jgi:hypothetical protein
MYFRIELLKTSFFFLYIAEKFGVIASMPVVGGKPQKTIHTPLL